MKHKKSKGFTLLEILLVITAIGILASIVLVSINPNRQIAQVRDATRRSDINTIYKALEQYLIDNGSYPNSVNSNYKDICKTGSEQVGGTLSPTTLCDNKADLRALVPEYLASIPTAPSGGIYRVGINGDNKIAVYTIGDSNQKIAINFATTNFGIIDVDALNYITAIETADGQELEDNVKIAINNFIIGLKTDGIWEAIKASVIMAGARTLNGALVPLKGAAPTNFNFVSGDYNRKTGLVGDGSTKYLDSNRNNDADPQNSKHLSIYKSVAPVSSTSTYIASQITSPVASSSRVGDNSGVAIFAINSNTPVNSSYVFSQLGFLGTSRGSTTSLDYRVSTITITGSNSINFHINVNTFVFARNINGSPNQHTNARLSFYSIGESIDLAKLDTRVSQLMTDYANAIP